MSRVTAIISALVICIIVCLSWVVNHYRDNAITYKAQQDVARELKLAMHNNMQMRQHVVADVTGDGDKQHDVRALSVAVIVAIADLLFVSQCVKPPPLPAWIMQPPPDWQTPLNGIISPSERG